MQNIILTGFMGTGKTKVGFILAKRLKTVFLDLDSLIEETEGKTIPEIFSEKGEEYFRQAETETIIKALREEGKVISTGGGALIKEENRKLLMEGGILIRLSASPEEIYKRVGTREGRPLLKGDDPLKVIRELLAKRRRFYEEVPFTILTDGRSPDEVADEIISLLIEKKII
ncbi:MAG: shikimate kinase [Firmicutes bacterium HGW-Firmicutes-13]|nr:MAG: shikimate kinase [Firmicutes bacterium HGW-Firmicutes-13]